MGPVKQVRRNIIQKKAKKQMDVGESSAEDNYDDVPEDIQIIAQEVQIVKALACNDLGQRNRQMKRLRKWLQIRTKSSFTFSKEDFMRIWKGLYYNMWYSDKPIVQEELAEKLGKLLECFEGNLQYCVDFFGAFLKTMCIEWFGIDQWRIDKFLMLVRRMLRYMFNMLKSSDWSLDAIELFNKHATETVLFENVSPKGLTMHYFDIFLEELAKVSEGNISAEKVGIFVKPFVKFMATQRDFNLISHCRTRIFYHLLYQSRLGREFTEKYNAWKNMGFPTKHIDDLEKIESEENLDDIESGSLGGCSGNKHLDPRAGNVDVFMPELPLDAQFIIAETERFLYKVDCATKRRKVLNKLLDLFKTYQSGKFPLGIKTMPRFEVKSETPLIEDKIRQLDNLENELYGVDRKLKQMTKRKRRKFLKSLNFDEIDESNYEKILEKALPKDYFRERRKRSKKSFMSGWVEEELNEDDIKPKKPKKDTISIDNFHTNKQHKEYEFELQNLGSTEYVRNSEKELKSTPEENDCTFKLNNKRSKKMKGNIKENYNELPNKQSDISKMSVLEEKITRKFTPELKVSESGEKTATNEWDEPLCEGEIEYFLPSRKIQLKMANADFVLNPIAKKSISEYQSTPVSMKLSSGCTPKTSSSKKRVKIALKHNTSQNPIEYIQQIKSSPNIPFDAKRKPGKGLLKPNTMPSPINPFYKKKIGLKLLNETA